MFSPRFRTILHPRRVVEQAKQWRGRLWTAGSVFSPESAPQASTRGVTQYMRSEVPLLHSGMALDVLGTGFDQFPSELRDAIVGRYPREDFKEGIAQAAFEGFANKPGTTYGTVWAGSLNALFPVIRAPMSAT